MSRTHRPRLSRPRRCSDLRMLSTWFPDVGACWRAIACRCRDIDATGRRHRTGIGANAVGWPGANVRPTQRTEDTVVAHAFRHRLEPSIDGERRGAIRRSGTTCYRQRAVQGQQAIPGPPPCRRRERFARSAAAAPSTIPLSQTMNRPVSVPHRAPLRRLYVGADARVRRSPLPRGVARKRCSAVFDTTKAAR